MVKSEERLSFDIDVPGARRNWPVSALVEAALEREEGFLTESGALAVWTGMYTGRSPKDRFIVSDEKTRQTVNWGAFNQAIERDAFDRLHKGIVEFLKTRNPFVFDGFVGADPRHRLAVRVYNEKAWQNLFIRQLLIRPTEEELKTFKPDFQLFVAPSFQADPTVNGTNSEAFILIDPVGMVGLIGGTHYAGEQKKLIFTLMNYLLPEQGVLPMHCSANSGSQGDVALFFGLSGTGKTTLSTDPNRSLIGDDEHGWSDQGIFNFEGGCYAKTIGLSPRSEPEIYQAIRFGAILENADVDEVTRRIDFDSDKYTENTRAGYPLDHIPRSVEPSVGGHPDTIVFLTADAFGVLPPVSRLDGDQAMYHFLSGYTSKLAGTERGVTTPEATFSACFGAPFLLRSPGVYAELLGERIREHGTRVYLVNTGWTGGGYGVGRRMNLSWTREMVRAAIDGTLEEVPFDTDPIFGVAVPRHCPGVPDEVLRPKESWQDKAEYDRVAKELAQRFKDNFDKLNGAPPELRRAGPRV